MISQKIFDEAKEKVDTSLTVKTRGRPPNKNKINPKILLNVFDKNNENNNIEVGFKGLTIQDIEKYKNNEVSISDNNIEISDNLLIESIKDNDLLKEINELRKKINVIENENIELKKYCAKAMPMYHTEITYYPSNINTVNINGQKIIPEKTNTRCLWCGYTFKTFPAYLIIDKYDNIFVKLGDKKDFLFCSFNCAQSYNISLNDEDIGKRNSFMVQFYYEINKDNISGGLSSIIINEAGPRELLQEYGGEESIDTYRRNFKIPGLEYQKMTFPLISSIQCVKVTIVEKNEASRFINNHPNSTKKKASKINNKDKDEIF